MSKTLPFVALLACGLVWGGTIPMTKIATSTGHHPFGLLVWQFAIASILLGVIVWWRKSAIVIDKRHLIFFLVIALIGTLVPNAVSYVSYAQVPAGIMALVIALVPVFSLIVAAAFGYEQPTPKRLAGVVLGGIAIALIVLPESSLPDPSKVIFVLLGLVAPFCYGVEGNYVAQKQPDDTGPFATLFVSSLIGLVLVTPIAVSGNWMIDPRAGLGAPEWALIGASVLHVGAYTGYLWLTRAAGAVFAAQVAYIVTPAGVVFSWLFLDELLSIFIWLALVVLMIGIALVQPRQRNIVAIETH